MIDLFGNPFNENEPVKAFKVDGYARTPGSGPSGETCGTCNHCCRLLKRYLKCDVVRHRWTGGPGTDIRAKAAACSMWVKKEVKP